MRTADFDYELPPHLIAQTPIEPRDHARLLVVDRASGAMAHHRFFELPGLLRPGDLLVANDSRVLLARLLGRREGTGGQVELLLLRRLESGQWETLARPARRLRPGARLVFDGAGERPLRAEVLAPTPAGGRIVSFDDEGAAERIGRVPLPPYIRAPLADPERYQTVYARPAGSAAAPTAGLHFTPELLTRLADRGVELAFITLHIGLDTFRPVDEEDPRQHSIHTEYLHVSPATADRLNRARAAGRRIIAVGTTAVRALETVGSGQQAVGSGPFSAVSRQPSAGNGQSSTQGPPSPGLSPLSSVLSPRFVPFDGPTNLFILPGFEFRAVDALITNFHLPRSTLLMLVAAFAGKDLIDRAYREAIAREYRFYSFGDCCLLL